MDVLLDAFSAKRGCRVLPGAMSVGRNPAPSMAELQTLRDTAAASRRLYVGATQDPCRRWAGCPETGMVGHRRAGYAGMLVIGARRGKAGATVEASLIVRARDLFGDRVDNRAMDARGLVVSRNTLNFLYICHSHS